ncbi:hypothetical protein E5288_WYG019842 [Bos mutus]|uniref:Uncharacterized protein n=1 Tax=Bos mutus TaxID=72004 RepID=A0A6B0RTC6_9CETA|nr:hypothetical protein [Bos mutus]
MLLTLSFLFSKWIPQQHRSDSKGTLVIGYESALLGHCINQDIFVKRQRQISATEKNCCTLINASLKCIETE